MNSEGEILSWSSHPLRKSKRKTVFLVAFMLLVWVLVFFVSGFSFLLLGLAVVVLMSSLASYFFPTRYELTQDLVRVKFLGTRKERRWENFKSFYPDKNGVFLSSFARPTRLENYRGLYLRYDGEQDRVLAYVKSKVVTDET